jgi:hypothetical protein
MALPSRAKFRREKLLPMWAQSNKERVEPIIQDPKMDIEEPSRAQPLKEKELPK